MDWFLYDRDLRHEKVNNGANGHNSSLMLSSIARVGANELQFVRQRVASLKHCGPTSCDSTTLGAASCEQKNL